LGAQPKGDNLTKTLIFRCDDIKLLRDLPCRQDQPLKSADDHNIRILKNKINTYYLGISMQLKKEED
jgi:hypothetical protein